MSFAPIAKFRTPVAKFRAPFAKFCAPVAKFRAPVTKFRAPVTKFRTPVTNFHAPDSTLLARDSMLLAIDSELLAKDTTHFSVSDSIRSSVSLHFITEIRAFGREVNYFRICKLLLYYFQPVYIQVMIIPGNFVKLPAKCMFFF